MGKPVTDKVGRISMTTSVEDDESVRVTFKIVDGKMLFASIMDDPGTVPLLVITRALYVGSLSEKGWVHTSQVMHMMEDLNAVVGTYTQNVLNAAKEEA